MSDQESPKEVEKTEAPEKIEGPKPEPRQITPEEGVVATHANVIASHAQAIQQGLSTGLPLKVLQVHVDAITSHALDMGDAAEQAAASKLPAEPETKTVLVPAKPDYTLALLAALGGAFGGVLLAAITHAQHLI